jgi:hypothetical protein
VIPLLSGARGYRGPVGWWEVFGIVVGVLVVGALVAAALLDRQARARGFRYRPEMARSLRKQRGELRDRRAAALFRDRRRRGRGREPGHPGERYS